MLWLSTILYLVLVFFPTLQTTTDGANFMEKYQNIIVGSIFFIVTYFQLELFSIATRHSFKSIIFGIIFIIMIQYFTPVLELSLFSFMYCILWALSIGLFVISLCKWILLFVIALREWISRVKILYSQRRV